MTVKGQLHYKGVSSDELIDLDTCSEDTFISYQFAQKNRLQPYKLKRKIHVEGVSGQPVPTQEHFGFLFLFETPTALFADSEDLPWQLSVLILTHLCLSGGKT